jgi:hypothetical protein
MNFFRNIWKTLFGKASKNEPAQLDKVSSAVESKLSVIHKKEDVGEFEIEGFKAEDAKIKKGRTFVEHELGESRPSLRDDIEGLKNLTDSSEEEVSKIKKNRKRDKKIVRAGKESRVRKHLEKYGSIDKETSALLFGVKRLDCMILSFRKQGLNIVSENIELTNENGEKTKVNNYVLVNSDGAN